MSRLILKGDIESNFGKNLPVPYIERIEIRDADPDDVTEALGGTSKSHAAVVAGTVDEYIDWAESGDPRDDYRDFSWAASKLTVLTSLMFNSSDDFLLEDFRDEFVGNLYITFFLLWDEEMIVKLKKSKRGLKAALTAIMNDSDEGDWTAVELLLTYKTIQLDPALEFTLDRDDQYNQIIKSSNVSVDLIVPNLDDAVELVLFAAVSLRPPTELTDYTDIVFAMNFGDVANEPIMHQKQLAQKNSEGYFAMDNSYYSGAPLLGLNNKYHKTESFGAKEVIDGIRNITSQYEQYRGRNDKLDAIVDNIEFIIAKYAEEPTLIAQLNKYATMFPNRTGASRIGRFYERYRRAVINANSALIAQPQVEKRLIRSAKLEDYRIFAFDPEFGGSYDENLNDSDFVYDMALQTNLAKFIQVAEGDPTAEVSYTPETAAAALTIEAIEDAIKPIPGYNMGHPDILAILIGRIGRIKGQLLGDMHSATDQFWDMLTTPAPGARGPWAAGPSTSTADYAQLFRGKLVSRVVDTAWGLFQHDLYGARSSLGQPHTTKKCTLEFGYVDKNCNLMGTTKAYKCFKHVFGWSNIGTLRFTQSGGDDHSQEYTLMMDNPSAPGGSPAYEEIANETKETIQRRSDDILAKMACFAVPGDPNDGIDAMYRHSFLYKMNARFASALGPIFGEPKVEGGEQRHGGMLIEAFSSIDAYEELVGDNVIINEDGEIDEDAVNQVVTDLVGNLGSTMRSELETIWDQQPFSEMVEIDGVKLQGTYAVPAGVSHEVGTAIAAGGAEPGTMYEVDRGWPKRVATRVCPGWYGRYHDDLDTPDSNKKERGDIIYGGFYKDLYRKTQDYIENGTSWGRADNTENVPSPEVRPRVYGDYSTSGGAVTPGRFLGVLRKSILDSCQQIWKDEYRSTVKTALKTIIPILAAYHGQTMGVGRHRKLALTNIVVQKYGWFFFDMEKYISFNSNISNYMNPSRMQKFLSYGRDILNQSIRLKKVELKWLPYAADSVFRHLSYDPTVYMSLEGNTNPASETPLFTRATFEGSADTTDDTYVPQARIKAMQVSSWRDFCSNTDNELLSERGGTEVESSPMFAHMSLRGFDFTETKIPDDYRLMAFNYSFFIDDDTAIACSDNYEVTVTIEDNSLKVMEEFAIFLENYYNDFVENYYLLAKQNCAYNEFDAGFNTFFKEKLMQQYEDNPADAPWITAPTLYVMYRDLYEGTYDGDTFVALEEARKLMDAINPETGWLGGLEEFKTNLEILIEEFRDLVDRVDPADFETEYSFTTLINGGDYLGINLPIIDYAINTAVVLPTDLP